MLFFSKPCLLMCNYSIMKIPVKLSFFHKQILLAWSLIFMQFYTSLYINISLFSLIIGLKKMIIFVSHLHYQNGSICNYSEVCSCCSRHRGPSCQCVCVCIVGVQISSIYSLIVTPLLCNLRLFSTLSPTPYPQ